MSPLSQRCSDGARLRLVPAVIRQYSKVSPRLVSSRRSASVSSRLVAPGACPAITASIESITASEATLSLASSSALFTERSRSSTNSASEIFASGNASRSAACESTGRKASSAPIRRAGMPALRMCATALPITSTEPDELACTSATHSGSFCVWKLSSRWPKNAALSGAPLA